MNREEILRLKKEKDVVILAHYYVDGAVQQIADYVGDSYFLSKIATEVEQKNILFCGVEFMGESAKLLNPKKRVYMADATADCPMAHMVDVEHIEQIKSKYDDVSVVCYVNSTAEIKSHSDVCVTSSNAVRVVKALKEKNIYFIPDNNLGRFVANSVPEKNFIFHEGFCHVHKSITKENVQAAKNVRKNALILTHPECTQDVIEISDFVGSTSEIIDYAVKSENKEFIICTEMGVFFELEQRCPDKKFYSVGHRQFCPNMKKIRMDKVENVLEGIDNESKDITDNEIILDEDVIKNAKKPLEKMLELAK